MCVEGEERESGGGKFSEESFPLPYPGPPPISFQRLLTGGEAARREFGSAERKKIRGIHGKWNSSVLKCSKAENPVLHEMRL